MSALELGCAYRGSQSFVENDERKMSVPRFVRVAKTSDIVPDTAIRLEIEGQEIAVYNVNGEYLATSDICTHMRASLSAGSIENGVVICPLHGMRYEIKTGEVIGTRRWPNLRIYTVRVEGDNVEIEL
jgi:nitrite reductase/ring-hydroxylating ferredoxin subunit